MYRYHPEIEGLKVNEDGSEVLYCGEALQVRTTNRKERVNDMLYVVLKGRTHTVGRLVAECWIGLPENPRWCAIRKNKNNGWHYTNLFFAPCGTNPEMGTDKVKRSSLSKLTKSDITVIKQRLKAGETLKAIAIDYKVSDMTISRIKKKMQRE